MNPDPLARYLARLPTFITFFFSVMLVTVFKELASIFAWTTGPSFSILNPAHALITISFLATLFFVIAVWLSYSLLIERFPYTLEYGEFIFDVVRFSVLYMVFNFAFLAGHPPYYFYFIGSLGAFHLLMGGWHAERMRHCEGAERTEHLNDVRGHGMRAGIYFVIAIAYFVTVTLNWQATQSWGVHAAFVVVTSGLLVFWNLKRLMDMRAKAQQSHAAALAQHPVAAPGE